MRIGEFSVQEESEVVVESEILSSKFQDFVFTLFNEGSSNNGHQNGINTFIHVLNEGRQSILNTYLEFSIDVLRSQS